ncbi:MAG: glycosyl hydrolase family 18 protein [Anaerolineaceae bacterium]
MLKIKILVITLILALCLSGCTSNEVATALPTTAQPTGKMVIGYYPSWATGRGVPLRAAPTRGLTHINYAFSNISTSGECVLGDPAADVDKIYAANESITDSDDINNADFHGNFNQLFELKKQNPQLKVLISVGGWNWSGNFSNAAKDETSRKRFAASCIDLYLKQYAGVFDGIDIDWEYPVSGGLTNGSSDDTANFTLLLNELRLQMDALGETNGEHYLLTIAAPVGPGSIRNLDLPGIAAAVDWINLMTYDFHGTWDATTNFNAPLFRTVNDPADAALNADAAVQTYLAEGVPAAKLVMGVPFYGRGWSGVMDVDHGLYQSTAGAAPGTHEAGSFEYNDIRDRYLPTWQYYWNQEANVPWLYDSASQIFISFDDARSLEAKAGYIKDQGLAGVMIWEISQGDQSLIDGIYAGFANGGPAKPTLMTKVLVPRPFEASLHAVNNINVDGQLTDWSEPPDFVLDQESQVVFTAAANSWSGPEDLSANAWAGWTSEGLYFAFKVTDDHHVQSAADDTLWHGDHMEIQLDTQMDEDYDNPGMNDDDFQIGLSLGNLAQVSSIGYAWFNGAFTPGEIQGLEMAYTMTDTGYILEAFIPLKALSGISLAEGAVFGMNISPSDSDTIGGSQETMLSTSSIRTYADPRTFGKITLVK